MRCLHVLCCVFLMACQNGTGTLPPEISRADTEPTAEASVGLSLTQVVARIFPAATALCRKINPQMPQTYCAFQIRVDGEMGDAPNAYQEIGPQGRPVIGINPAMMAGVRHADELAFVIAHEAGHQVASHLLKRKLGLLTPAPAFAAFLPKADGPVGALRASRRAEMEADAIAAILMQSVGYDPVRGVQALVRLSPPVRANSTHPPAAKRVSSIAAIADHLRQGWKIGR